MFYTNFKVSDIPDRAFTFFDHLFNEIKYGLSLKHNIPIMNRGPLFIRRYLTANIYPIKAHPPLRQRNRYTPIPTLWRHNSLALLKTRSFYRNTLDLNQLAFVWHSLDTNRCCGRPRIWKVLKANPGHCLPIFGSILIRAIKSVISVKTYKTLKT